MASKQIWLIGGTTEAIAIAKLLDEAAIPYIATVTTAAAASLYRNVQVGRLSAIAPFITAAHINAIVDASHPFATEISRGAIATGLPYLRYERASVPLLPTSEVIPDWATLLTLSDHEHVLLTTGIKTLQQIPPDDPRFWLRILPRSRDQALAAGWPRLRLILSDPKPPLPLERSLIQRLGITTLVSKASGQAGGVDRKQALAAALGLRCLIIARPAIAYPAQTDCYATVLHFCQQILA